MKGRLDRNTSQLASKPAASKASTTVVAYQCLLSCYLDLDGRQQLMPDTSCRTRCWKALRNQPAHDTDNVQSVIMLFDILLGDSSHGLKIQRLFNKQRYPRNNVHLLRLGARRFDKVFGRSKLQRLKLLNFLSQDYICYLHKCKLRYNDTNSNRENTWAVFSKCKCRRRTSDHRRH